LFLSIKYFLFIYLKNLKKNKYFSHFFYFHIPKSALKNALQICTALIKLALNVIFLVAPAWMKVHALIAINPLII
jgi:hypothetical protein